MSNFIIGTNNDVAVYTAKIVVDDPGGKRNPFFLYGKTGVGKTHLIQAIGNELLRKNPNLKILYTPINHFYSDFTAAIRNKNPDSWKAKYENLDVLIVDDFQQITGKDKSQVEFFNLFNDMYLSKRQVIVASDRLPEEIRDVDPFAYPQDLPKTVLTIFNFQASKINVQFFKLRRSLMAQISNQKQLNILQKM